MRLFFFISVISFTALAQDINNTEIIQIIIWSSNSINLVSIKKSVIANCDPYITADEVVKEIRKDGKESNYQYKGWMK